MFLVSKTVSRGKKIVKARLGKKPTSFKENSFDKISATLL